MEYERPDPDALLASIQKEDERRRRGKLKIFFGMAAGVGKTYAMLEDARRVAAEGVDVVIGIVETHGRVETEALLDGLELMPRLHINYRGATLPEMDVDAILTRRPALVLVDELAHSNAPGVRHLKRYQDVEELLEAGIDVYTTVNVQHFESRADAVRQITGITVHETVPDTLLELADEIELIDLTPEELRRRLAEGKVYTPERSDVAARNFFRPGNLTALREMALRLTAERVDHQLQDYMDVKRIAGPWKSAERLMVAIGPAPFSERLIRWTRRMAYNLEAPWLAVHVVTSRPLDDAAQQRVNRHFDLARSLGGELITIAGDDVPAALVHLAHQRNVTQIVIGKPLRTRWQELGRGGSNVDRLIRSSGAIDVYVVTGDEADGSHSPSARPALPAAERRSGWRSYWLAVGLIGLMTLIDFLIVPIAGYQLVGLTDLLAVLLIAVYIGRGPALLAAALSALSWNFLFIEPRFTFDIFLPQDIALLLLYFAIALFAGNLTARLRAREQQARANAERNLALFTLTHETSVAVDMDAVLKTAVEQIGRVFDAEVAVLLPRPDGAGLESHPRSSLALDEKEMGVAGWVHEHGRVAGRNTDTLPTATARYYPLRVPSGTVGVLGIRRRARERLPFDQESLLATFVGQIALALERELLDDAAKQADLLRESERLSAALLNSISHELRTPLATILMYSRLLREGKARQPDKAERFLGVIERESDRLQRMVRQMLDLAKLETREMQRSPEPVSINTIFDETLPPLADRAVQKGLLFRQRIQPDLPPVMGNFDVYDMALKNLLENAIKFTPSGSVQIAAWSDEQAVTIEVSDEGIGIPAEAMNNLFKRFYRTQTAVERGIAGTGLGLYMVKENLRSYNGQIAVQSTLGKGSTFTIRLPIAQV